MRRRRPRRSDSSRPPTLGRSSKAFSSGEPCSVLPAHLPPRHWPPARRAIGAVARPAVAPGPQNCSGVWRGPGAGRWLVSFPPPPQGTMGSLGEAGGLCPPPRGQRGPWGAGGRCCPSPHLGCLARRREAHGAAPYGAVVPPLPQYRAFPELQALKLPAFSLKALGSGSPWVGMADSSWAPSRSCQHSLRLARGIRSPHHGMDDSQCGAEPLPQVTPSARRGSLSSREGGWGVSTGTPGAGVVHLNAPFLASPALR